MIWNHTFYRQSAREAVPGVLTVLAISIRLAMYPHPLDQQSVSNAYHAGKRMYRQWLKSLPSPLPPVEFPEDYSGAMLYQFPKTPRGTYLPQFVAILQLEGLYEDRHQAVNAFAQAMNRAAIRRKTPDRYDLFLVYAARVQGMQLSDDALDREWLRQYARMQVEQMVLEDGDVAAESIAESICSAIDEIEEENRG